MANRENLGHYSECSVAGEKYKAFIPAPLPPQPPLNMQGIYPLLDQANLAIGRLDGINITVPDPSLFIYMYIRKEAVLSSQIEGTQSTLTDLLLYENEHTTTLQDVQDISNYVAAMNYGLKRIENGFPLCMRLIREMHEVLLKDGRGSTKQPGEFRKSQNWIGGTRPGNARYVPPPWENVADLLSDLEKFLHDEVNTLPAIIKAALANLQFETIHPFVDGNGRLGRLLVTFILCVEGVLQKPLLYLSYYFKLNRQQYYELLQYVRDTGDWEEWVKFFLIGATTTADQAVKTIQTTLALFVDHENKIKAAGKAVASTLLVHRSLQKNPVTDSKKITTLCEISLPTAISSLNQLVQMDIVKEITGKSRNKIYVYKHYLDLLSEGIEISETSVSRN